MSSHDDHSTVRRGGRRHASAALVLALAIAGSLAFVPAAAGAAPASALASRAALPPIPRVTVPLRQGINAKPGLTAAQRVKVVADVAWLQGRLDVILPRIKWTKPLLSIDGVYGASTAEATKFFKQWGNDAHAALHLRPLFPKVDDGVGPSTVSIIALISAYFQVHPNGAPTSPQTPNQTIVMVLLNQHRAQFGVPVLAADPKLMVSAQNWAAHLASTGVLAVQEGEDVIPHITACAESLGQNVGSGGTIATLDAYLAEHDDTDEGHRLMREAKFTIGGVGVAYAPNNKLFIVQDFVEAC